MKDIIKTFKNKDIEMLDIEINKWLKDYESDYRYHNSTVWNKNGVHRKTIHLVLHGKEPTVEIGINPDVLFLEDILKTFLIKRDMNIIDKLIKWKNESIIKRKKQDVKEHENFIIKTEDKKGEHFCHVLGYRNVHRIWELLLKELNPQVLAIEDITELIENE